MNQGQLLAEKYQAQNDCDRQLDFKDNIDDREFADAQRLKIDDGHHERQQSQPSQNSKVRGSKKGGDFGPDPWKQTHGPHETNPKKGFNGTDFARRALDDAVQVQALVVLQPGGLGDLRLQVRARGAGEADHVVGH